MYLKCLFVVNTYEWSAILICTHPQLWTLPHCQQLSCQRELGGKHICLFSFIGDLVLLAENFLSKLSIKFVTNRIYDCKALLFFFFCLLACIFLISRPQWILWRCRFISFQESFLLIIFEFFSCLLAQPSLLGITIILVLDSFFLPFITFSNTHWKDSCWSWGSNTLATWFEEPAHWKRPWRWERLKAKREEGSRGWDSYIAAPTQWILIWANSRRQWKTEKPGMLQSMGLQRIEHN